VKPGPLDQPKKYDYWIRNGNVIDPRRGVDKVADVLVCRRAIVDLPPGGRVDEHDVRHIVDAGGYDVLPGLIDFHGHFAWLNADESCMPDSYELPNGVTSACDGGSTGSAGFEGFLRSTILQSELTMKALINVASGGLATHKYTENVRPENYDEEGLRYLFARYADHILGLKLRMGRGISDGMGAEPLSASVRLADKLGTILAVHPTNTLVPFDEIVPLLRAGDVLCHPFQQMGDYSILDGGGRVLECVRDAKRRGVVFDCSHGRINFSFVVAAASIAQGLMPDVLSTDISTHSMYLEQVFSLPMVMTRFLAMGMPLVEVVRACTETPARIMGMEGRIGTLQPGALADICIMKRQVRPVKLTDFYGNTVEGERVLVPQMTIKAGRTKYCHMDFILR
jgi:dihydroorotase